MVCPECGSIEITKDPEGQFCKKCGLELGEIVIDNKGRKKCQVVQIPKIEVIIDPRKPTKKRIKRVIVDSDLKLLDRIRALKYGMVTLNSKLRKKISDLEFKLATMVPGKDISALMNMIVDKADSEAKLGIFKRILRDKFKINNNLVKYNF